MPHSEKQRAFFETRNNEIIKLILGGSAVEDIASKFEIEPKSVWGICQRNGVSTAGRWKSRTGRRKRGMSDDDFYQWIKTQCILIDNGCFLWTGNINELGYGRVRHGGPLVFVHRFVYELVNKIKLNKSQFVCHKCDTPGCCRIEHLWVGSPQENVDDREAKGRNVVHRGSASGMAKINEEIAKEIRAVMDRVTEKRSPTARILAEKYGVSIDLIYRIKHRQLWKNIEG